MPNSTATTSPTLDLAIIGSGPAAFAAALYAAREKLTVTIFERDIIGGLASTISKIENYPGFTGTGADLMSNMRAQAESFGAIVRYGDCSAIHRRDSLLTLTVDDQPISARAVLIATGTERRKLAIPGEDLPGVSFCATCDAPLTAGKPVVVIGSGNSAAQESLLLAKHASHVTILSRKSLHSDPTLLERIQNTPNITPIDHATPTEFTSTNGHLAGVNYQTEQGISTLLADHAFIFVGSTPATSFLPPEILAPDGAVITDQHLATTIPGIFAAGDCRHDSIKQAITATAEGATAALSIANYLS